MAALTVGLTLALLPGISLALDPSRRIADFFHSQWTAEQGAPGNVEALAQSKDGFLWLGADEGLFRFDGVSFERIPPFSGKSPRSESVTALLADASGDVWVGHRWGGLSVYRDGKLWDANPAPPHGGVIRIVEDRQGAIWVATDGRDFAGLERYAHGRWDVVDASWGLPKAHLSDIMVTRDGDLWVGFAHALYRLPHGARRFEFIRNSSGWAPSLAEAPNGRIWVADSLGVYELPLHPTAAANGEKPNLAGSGLNMRSLLFDRDGALWDADKSKGLFRLARANLAADQGGHVHPGALESATDDRSRTSGPPNAIAEDREGDIWVGGGAGIDRLKAASAVTALKSSPTPSSWNLSLTASNRGAIYATNYVGDQGEIVTVAPGGTAATVATFSGVGGTVCPAADGGAWVFAGKPIRLAHVKDRRVDWTTIPAAFAERGVGTCAQDRQGRLWAGVYSLGLYRFSDGRWTQFTPDASLAGAWPWRMAADTAGGVLMYFPLQRLVRVDGDTVRTISDEVANRIGLVNTIVAAGPVTYLGGESGLARYDGRDVRFLSSARFPFLRQISAIARTEGGQTWLLTASGLVRVVSSQLDAAFDDPRLALPYSLYDAHDGVPAADRGRSINGALEAGDGRLWFQTDTGIAWIDPNRLYRDSVAPPVVIRSLIAERKTYPARNGLRLPSGASALAIDYTALSLATPEKTRFRYRLSGVDKGWVDPGPRRQAIYTNLSPGDYVFQVIAANGDGVWNPSGARLQFTIPPTFIQSRVFFALCVAAVLAALWWLYSLRLQQIAARERVRVQGQLDERERISRELHDTLLQGFQGLILRFQWVAEHIPPGHEVRELMEEALQRADEVLVEGRDRVTRLRGGAGGDVLTEVFRATAARLAAESPARFKLVVEGDQRVLRPSVHEEVIMIGNEALSNAFRHADARTIQVTLRYERAEFVLSVRDDGRGIDPVVLERGREGHIGLAVMRERAEIAGGRLVLTSAPGKGAEAILTLPAKLAYEPAMERRSGFWLRNGSAKG